MEHVAFVRQKTIKTATCIKTGRAVELMKITNVPIRTSALIFQSHACGEMTLRVVSHYEDFEPTSYDNSYSSCGGNDDNCDSEKNVYEQALQREVEVDESVKAARAKAEVERIKLQQQIDAAEQRAKLAELERKRKNEEEWQERQDKQKAAIAKHREELENSKDYRIAAVLAILLGWIGAHKFYIGKYTSGVVYAIFCWAWIPGILGIITGLKWLSKGQDKFIDELMDDWDC